MPELTIHALAELNLFPIEIRIEDLETLGSLVVEKILATKNILQNKKMHMFKL
jgi:hypothetical protein